MRKNAIEKECNSKREEKWYTISLYLYEDRYDCHAVVGDSFEESAHRSIGGAVARTIDVD